MASIIILRLSDQRSTPILSLDLTTTPVRRTLRMHMQSTGGANGFAQCVPSRGRDDHRDADHELTFFLRPTPRRLVDALLRVRGCARWRYLETVAANFL
jgi:hypothetical protein